jgi:hypothetical protein
LRLAAATCLLEIIFAIAEVVAHLAEATGLRVHVACGELCLGTQYVGSLGARVVNHDVHLGKKLLRARWSALLDTQILRIIPGCREIKSVRLESQEFGSIIFLRRIAVLEDFHLLWKHL